MGSVAQWRQQIKAELVRGSILASALLADAIPAAARRSDR
jgi:hypothetical protein